MSNINLDPIIRKLSGPPQALADEEVLVTIDLATKKAVEKSLWVRVAGNFQDYLVANNRNPTRTVSGRFPTYYVRDAQNERTLSLEISIVAASCPVGQEVKVAEALHSEQPPTQALARLLERWVREFIPAGDESKFIDTYDAARHQLERHIARLAESQTGLEMSAKVSLSGEPSVLEDIVVGPVEIGVRLNDYKEEQKITVEAGLAFDAQNYVKAFVFQEKQASPEELFKRHLKAYFSHHVSFQQFSRELRLPGFNQSLLRSLSAALQQVGRSVSFVNFPTSQSNTIKSREFVPVTYPYRHTILGRPQVVEIQNIVQLYLENSVAFKVSGMTDSEVEAWVRSTLNVILKRNLIGKTYVDLLLRFAPLEQSIKRELSVHAASIGYKVDHLVSIPDLEEKELTEPFFLEIEDDFETKLDDFKVQVKFGIKLRVRDLQSIEKYLNRGTDVKVAIKERVLSEARQCLRNVHPERFYLYFNHPDENLATTTTEPDDGLAVKDLLSKKIADSLRAEFDAEIFELMPRVGRTDLTDRYNNLCYVIREFRVSIEPPDPQGTESLTLTGNFEVRGVYSDPDGWQRFSAMRLDLDGLQTQLENHLKAELKTYYQSSFMFQNRMGRKQVFALVENYASLYMRREFGLIIHLTNLDRNSTQVEERQRQMLIDLETKKLGATMAQGQLLVNNLMELGKRRAHVLSVFPVDKETLRELDENIKLLQDELGAITSSRFGQHRVAAALEDQRPDELPQPGETEHAAVQYELESGPKGQLTD
jgi:hypothetical protein